MGLSATPVFVFLVVTTARCHTDSLEPLGCSRVEWEDTMLQKMIRTELTTKDYMERLEKALETLKVQTEIFEESRKALEQTREDVKRDLGHTTREVKNEVQQINQELRKETSDRLNTMENIVSGFEATLLVPTVSFNVRGALAQSPAANQIITFEHVIQNLGGAYDDVTGIFTALNNGTYFFGAQVCSSVQKYGILQIVVDSCNNAILTITDYDNNVPETSAGGTVIQYLVKGQRVWLQNQYSETKLFDRDDQCWNQFTGVLIHL